MTIRLDTDYNALLDQKLTEFSRLHRERDEIDARLANLRQFIYATINMLPEAERAIYQNELTEIASPIGGLTDAIRETLKLATQRQTYFTAAQVRDHLVQSGFDFRRYTSNPLASVSTVLRRLKGGEVETKKIDGVSAYRWIFRFPRLEKDPEYQGRFKPRFQSRFRSRFKKDSKSVSPEEGRSECASFRTGGRLRQS